MPSLPQLVKPEVFGKSFLPQKIRLHLEKRMLLAGYKSYPYRFFGMFFYISILAMIILYLAFITPEITIRTIGYTPSIGALMFALYSFAYSVVFLAIVIAFGWYLFQYILDAKILSRTKQVEEVLEDYLRYVSENLKGGMSFDASLWNSVKPEFGVLSEEIQLCTKKVMTGTPLDIALTEFTSKYDSPMLKRSFDIIIEALHGGGKISDILDDLVGNLQGLKELKQEMITTNMSYTIFITAVVLFITPLLFALATQFIVILNAVGEKVGGATAGQSAGAGLGGFSFSGAALSIDQFKNFALIVLVVNSLGAAALTAIMNKGDFKQGGTSYLVYPLVAGVLYYVAATFMTSIFSTFVPN
jgi:pilus assembly protein TadC